MNNQPAGGATTPPRVLPPAGQAHSSQPCRSEAMPHYRHPALERIRAPAEPWS